MHKDVNKSGKYHKLCLKVDFYVNEWRQKPIELLESE